MTAVPAARQLAEYITDLRYEDLHPATIEATKGAILDQLGIMLTGSTLPWTRPAYDVAVALGCREEATIVGSTTKVSMPDAAMVNANYGHSCEFDDSGYQGGGHAGAIAVPAALAVTEADGLSGRDLLLGVVSSYQVQYQVGRVLTRAASHVGFHGPTSIGGPFGAAAVVGVLRHLSADIMVHALSIAGSHVSGTMEYDRSGGEVKRFHSGMATRAGIISALLAERGLTGPATIFEGPRGIVPLFAHLDDASGITANLDDKSWFAVERRTVKMYPCVGQLPTSIQALEKLIAEHHFGPEDVERIDVWVTPHTLGHGAAIDQPKDTVGAQFSMKFGLSLLLHKGKNELRDYMDPSLWSHPVIRDLSGKIFAHGDESYVFGNDKGSAARVKVALRDGRAVEHEETYRWGSPKNPITKADLERKFTSLATAVLDDEGVRAVIDAVDRLEDLPDVRTLVSFLSGTRTARVA